jgi:hypothetical protein
LQVDEDADGGEVSALFACAGMGREARREPVERLDEHGISARILEVEAGSVLQMRMRDPTRSIRMTAPSSERSHAPAARNWRVVP